MSDERSIEEGRLVDVTRAFTHGRYGSRGRFLVRGEAAAGAEKLFDLVARLQRGEVGELVLFAFIAQQLRTAVFVPRGSKRAGRDLLFELGEVPALQEIVQVARRENELPIESVHGPTIPEAKGICLALCDSGACFVRQATGSMWRAKLGDFSLQSFSFGG